MDLSRAIAHVVGSQVVGSNKYLPLEYWVLPTWSEDENLLELATGAGVLTSIKMFVPVMTVFARAHFGDFTGELINPTGNIWRALVYPTKAGRRREEEFLAAEFRTSDKRNVWRINQSRTPELFEEEYKLNSVQIVGYCDCNYQIGLAGAMAAVLVLFTAHDAVTKRLS